MSLLISHELPVSYLNCSFHINDYEYCLVHLCDEYPEYLEHYKYAVKDRREVLLDNSIFELGVAFDSARYAERIKEIQPTFYIVPDVLEDGVATIESWKNFIEDHGDLPGLKIGVAQGKDFKEFIECYKFMSEHADYIAISFDYSWYAELAEEAAKLGQFPHPTNKLQSWCYGRVAVINYLIQSDTWNHGKPHHLLGCSLAKEFGYYIGIRSIRSVDTSNPVVAALEGRSYIRRIGLFDKSKVKLADQINVDHDHDTSNLIYENAAEFRRIATHENYAQS